MKQQSPASALKNNFSVLLVLFFIASAAGYAWEVLLFLLMSGGFTNRGFFHGPWLPVYGLGAVLLAGLLEALPKKLKTCLPVLFVLSASVCTATEYVLALYLERVRHVRYWDYSGWPLAIEGRVSLVSFLFFGLGGLLLENGLMPAIRRLHLRPRILRLTLWTVCILFAIDLIYSCAHPNMGPNISARIG